MKPAKPPEDDESTAPRRRPFRLYVRDFHYEGELQIERIPLLAGHFNNVGRITGVTRRHRDTGATATLGDIVADVYGADAQDCTTRTKQAADIWCDQDARTVEAAP